MDSKKDSRRQSIAPQAKFCENLYQTLKYGGWGLINLENCCAVELRNIDHDLANSDEMLVKVVAKLEKLGDCKIESKSECKKKKKDKKLMK